MYNRYALLKVALHVLVKALIDQSNPTLIAVIKLLKPK
jgi:hypothetical protein